MTKPLPGARAEAARSSAQSPIARVTQDVTQSTDLIDGSGDSALLLAHGAGAGMDSEFMATVASKVAALGVAVIRFEFPYMQLRRATGSRRPPDRMPALMDAYFQAVARHRGSFSKLVIGGKSMGGRVASMIADQVRVEGLVCLGYPFHPPKKPEVLRTEHLAQLRVSALIVQGTRDPFGTPEQIAGYTLSDNIRFHWLEDGDHGFKPRVRSGFTLQQHIDSAVSETVRFIGAIQ